VREIERERKRERERGKEERERETARIFLLFLSHTHCHPLTVLGLSDARVGSSTELCVNSDVGLAASEVDVTGINRAYNGSNTLAHLPPCPPSVIV